MPEHKDYLSPDALASTNESWEHRQLLHLRSTRSHLSNSTDGSEHSLKTVFMEVCSTPVSMTDLSQLSPEDLELMKAAYADRQPNPIVKG